jgi:hypothetical protein
MSRDLLLSGALLVGWYVMSRWVLPRLGVPT